MPGLMVRPPVLKKKASDFAGYSKELHLIEERINSVKNNMQKSSSIMRGIEVSLGVVQRKTEQCATNINKLGSTLELCGDEYTNTENVICNPDRRK